jgi:hypothetical protein
MSTEHKDFRIVFEADFDPEVVFGEKCVRGEICIGDYIERFNAPVEVWSRQEYLDQWREALERFRSGHQPTCLVTAMRDLAESDFISIWPIYKDGENAVFQNQVLLSSYIRDRFDGENVYDFIEPREIVSEDGELISEWKVSLDAVERFFNRF